MSDEYIRRSELPPILRDAVRQALDEYQHECVMNLRDGDACHVRDLINAIREIGDDNLPRGIAVVRDNHKFVTACHATAAKVGWGVIIATMTIMGTLGIIAVGLWRSKGGGL